MARTVKPKVNPALSEPTDFRSAGLDMKFMKMLNERQELVTVKKDAEAAVKDLNEKLLELQAITGYKTVLTPDWRSTITPGCNVTINKQKLLEFGVSVEVIEASTVRTPYTTLTVTSIKEKEK